VFVLLVTTFVSRGVKWGWGGGAFAPVVA
jgi:hypothetical protein